MYLTDKWARVWMWVEMQFYILSVEMYFGKRCLVGGGINQMYWFVSLKIILAKPKTRKEKTYSLHSVALPITQPRFSVKNRPFFSLNHIVSLNIYSDVSLVTDQRISYSLYEINLNCENPNSDFIRQRKKQFLPASILVMLCFWLLFHTKMEESLVRFVMTFKMNMILMKTI